VLKVSQGIEIGRGTFVDQSGQRARCRLSVEGLLRVEVRAHKELAASGGSGARNVILLGPSLVPNSFGGTSVAVVVRLAPESREIFLCGARRARAIIAAKLIPKSENLAKNRDCSSSISTAAKADLRLMI